MTAPLTFGDLTWNARDGLLIGPSASVRIQPKQGQLLTALIQADGTLSKDELRAALGFASSESVRVVMHAVRSALRDCGSGAWVHTRKGYGWRLIAPGVELEAA